MAYHVEGEIAEISIGDKKAPIGVRLIPSPDSIHRDGDDEKVLLMGEAESLLKPRGEFEKMVFQIGKHIPPKYWDSVETTAIACASRLNWGLIWPPPFRSRS